MANHTTPTTKKKNPAAVALGRLGAKARWSKMTRKERQTDMRWRRRKTATLTAAAVRAIMASHDKPEVLAQQYGVSTRTIYRIRAQTTWRDISIPNSSL